ncbi:hypothetical protein TL16_g08086 [Triparma laevis f. inornata]|uniref:Endonuclease/exonuclease/phosphatase domain-containing protein n=1 Tax=Triparma laevis f. inornata TaxID=1714386 RepID=A0A9W7B467_9STRA|nr:hypothetical protein TL16_g08086 [Triparma laevis f. inornata]
MPVSNDIANCTAMLDALYLCATPPKQFSNLYLYGDYSPCSDERHNLRVCMSAKVQSDPEEARKILQDLIVLRGEKDMRLRENSPTDKTIWNLKGKSIEILINQIETIRRSDSARTPLLLLLFNFLLLILHPNHAFTMSSFQDQLKSYRSAKAKNAAAPTPATTTTALSTSSDPPSSPARPPNIDPEAWSALPDDLKAELSSSYSTSTKRPRSPSPPSAPAPRTTTSKSASTSIDTITFGKHPYIRNLMKKGQVTLKPTTPKYAFSAPPTKLSAGSAKRPKPNPTGLSSNTAISLLSDSDSDSTTDSNPLSNPPTSSVTLPLLTQNLWFDESNQALRMNHLKNNHFSKNETFVACQELTAGLLQHLSPSSSSLYSLHDQQIKQSPNSGVGRDLSYGCAMLFPKTRAPTVTGTFLFSNSKMVRGLTFGIVDNILLASTHLESFNGPNDTGSANRAKQVSEFKEFVQTLVSQNLVKAAVVMGDMNWDDEKPTKSKRALGDEAMQNLLGPEWVDAFRNLYSFETKDGFTYDGKKNEMLGSYLCRRFDRILLYPAEKVEVSEAEIVGQEVIPGGGELTVPTTKPRLAQP